MPTDTVTNRKLNFKDGFFWTIAILVILINALFSFASVFEIYQISFTGIEKEYHWGADPFPWYYENKMTYLTYTSAWRILFLTTLFFQIYFAVKDNKPKELYSALFFILFFVVMLIANVSID